MAFEHTDKQAGDLIRSADWNALGTEVVRLGSDKISRVGAESLDGPLTVRGDLSSRGALAVLGDLSVGSPNAGASVRVLKRQEDGSDISHGALVLGSDATSSASLRLGYAAGYSWLQGQGQQSLALNPRGGNVGVGTANPTARLHVGGDALVTGALSFGTAVRQMLNLWGTQYGIGVQASTSYLRTDGNFAFYKGGTHADGQLDAGGGTVLLSVLGSGNVGIGTTGPAARLHVAGGDLRLDSGREIFFADNGQIRSIDNNHRILFRRTEDKLELREYGSIIFSPGATSGNETAKVVLHPDGTLSFGNNSHLQPDQGGSIELGGNNSTAGTGVPYIDFHFKGRVQDYNTRIINDADGRLSILAGSLEVRDCWAVSLACADFNIGHPSRKGGTGRALVDGKTALIINYGPDWPAVEHGGPIRQWSTRELKRDIAPLDEPRAAEILAGLEPVGYRMIADAEGTELLGFVAEDVPDVIAGPDHRTVTPMHVIAVLTRVVQAQQRRLDELTQRLSEGLSHA